MSRGILKPLISTGPNIFLSSLIQSWVFNLPWQVGDKLFIDFSVLNFTECVRVGRISEPRCEDRQRLQGWQANSRCEKRGWVVESQISLRLCFSSRYWRRVPFVYQYCNLIANLLSSFQKKWCWLAGWVLKSRWTWVKFPKHLTIIRWTEQLIKISFRYNWHDDDILPIHAGCHLLAVGQSVVQCRGELHEPLRRFAHLNWPIVDFVLLSNRWCAHHCSQFEPNGEGKWPPHLWSFTVVTNKLLHDFYPIADVHNITPNTVINKHRIRLEFYQNWFPWPLLLRQIVLISPLWGCS